MKILFVTDIHGIKWKYERVLHEAKALNIDLLINGGDMLPFGDFFKQDQFILNFLDKYFSKLEEARIHHLCMLANDDLLIYDNLFEKICSNYQYIHPIAQKSFKYNNLEFIGMNWVTDLPFALKDRARKDTEKFVLPKQFGKPVISTPNGWKKINDWPSYLDNLPTIEEELKKLITPINMSNTIYIFHMPPANIGLDVCHDGRKVGSKAIYDFIKNNQPKMTFHGHIHESAKVSGYWNSYINKTLCIQPGQSFFHEDTVICCIIDIETMEYKRLRLTNA